jgi:hypothetical protein
MSAGGVRRAVPSLKQIKNSFGSEFVGVRKDDRRASVEELLAVTGKYRSISGNVGWQNTDGDRFSSR